MDSEKVIAVATAKIMATGLFKPTEHNLAMIRAIVEAIAEA